MIAIIPFTWPVCLHPGLFHHRPLFFMLSGFTLAVVYGSKPWQLMGGTKMCGPNDTSAVMDDDTVPNDECKPFNWKGFYWNRFARVMPVCK